MGRRSWPSLTSGSQATRSQSRDRQNLQRILRSGVAVGRLTNAPSPTVPRYLGVTPAPELPAASSEHDAWPNGSSGQSALSRRGRQRPNDEPCYALSSKSSSRRTSKTTAAIEESLQHLRLSEPGHREHAGRKAGEGSASGTTERRSSIRANNQGRTPLDGNGCRSYAEVTRGSNSCRVKSGQLLWSPKVSSFLACFCCKMRAMLCRSSSPWMQSQLCQCVQDERTCRRGSADRHVKPGNAQTDVSDISLPQYSELNGASYARARNVARRWRLLGHVREEFLWREGFVFLYPDFEEVKNRLDPYGYDVTTLDALVVQVVETVRRRRQQQRTMISGLQAARHEVFDTDAAVQLTTHSGVLLPAHLGGGLYSGASGMYNHQGQRLVSESLSYSYSNAASLGSHELEPALQHPRSANPTLAHAFEQYYDTPCQGDFAIQEPDFGYQDAQDGMLTRRFGHNQYFRDAAHPLGEDGGRLIQPATPSGPESPELYQRPPSRYTSPHEQVRGHTSLSGPSESTYQEHRESFSGPWSQMRIHERHQREDGIQTTELRTPSSARHSTPGLTFEMSSARTGRSSHFLPPTPGGPTSPSPQIGHHQSEASSSIVRDLEIPLQYIDPRILDKNYRMEDFDHDAGSY